VSKIDVLRRNYQRICGLPWDRNIAGPQRVWLAVYDQEDERKLRLRLGLFEEATRATGHSWHLLDLTNSFADWLCRPPYSDYAESYFECPEDLTDAVLADYRRAVADSIIEALRGVQPAEDTVVAVVGVSSLFGFVRLSEVLPLVDKHIRGRLLAFFPGTQEENNYRLLDARDGWNYLAVPITADEGDGR
jgi:hypothetical protein